MAGNIGDLQVSLTANTSQLERDVSAALRRLESKGFNLGAGINARAFTQPLGRITGAANEFQKSLDASNARVIAFGASAGAIYNVQRAFTALIGSTIEVQKSLADINVILNASSKSLGQFGDQLFEIARNSGQAFSTVATAAGELARQGLTIEQTLKRTSDALILARLSGLDAASSVEALTAAINSFNQSALDSTQITNKLASVDAAFAVSSADLAEALKRVGSSAQDVGVSFDELLAIVASVNQTTARGGAVIGNSLKTIFTRIQRTDVLDQLEALGVAVRDLEGNTAPAIQVLTGLATKFDQLGDAQRAQIAELVGGVFQINVLKAALGDLSREYSVFGNALKISTNASDEAIRRNEELNKTLSALLNRTVANLTKVGSEIGGLSFQPAIERVLNGLNAALEGFDVKGDSIGSKIGKGIFEGIGSFVSGPGLALLIGVFLKIFGNLAKFTADAAKTILNLNKESQAQAQIQERINNILAQNPQLVQNILNKQTTLLQVERDILTVIQAQSQARQQSAAVASNISRGLVSRGVTVQGGAITTRTKSQGFVPNFSANKEIMGAISGGYMPGQVRSMNIPNYGRVTYNTAEQVKMFPGLSQPGIMPPESSDAGRAYKQKFKNKYSIDPYANKGFIPNFALSPSKIAARLSRGTMTQEQAAALGYKSTRQKQSEKTSFGIPVQSISPLLALRSSGAKQGYTFKPKDGPPIDVRFPVIPFDQQSTGFKLTDLRGNLDKVIDKSISDFATSIYRSRQLNPPIDLPSTIEQARKQADGLSGSIEGTIGGIFESAFRAAFGRSVKGTTGGANFDVARIPKDLGIFFPGATTGIPGDFKSSDSDENRRSMALKILSNQYPSLYKSLTSRTASSGFIPNFSPLDRAFSTEKNLGGKPTLDYKEGLGLYVRDGRTQPNFAAVMRDHPEGMQKAIKNSKMMQGMNSAGGFIPNFQAIDPMSIFFLAQSFLGGRGGDAGDLEQVKLEQQKYRQLLKERNLNLRVLKEVETAAIKDEKAINYARQEYNTSLSNLAQYQKQARLEGPIFTGRGTTQAQRAADFARRGGVGGAVGRFGARYGSGIALAAPLATGVASQFVGDEVTRTGRAQRAGVTGLGTVASFAGLGALVGGPIGAGVGATVGAGIAIYDVFKQLKDIMPEVAKEIEDANERFNNLSAGAQGLNTALETLRTAQERSDISAETRAKLVVKANEDFATSLNQIALVSKPASDEILKLYQTLGDTPDLRERINLELGKARESLDIVQSKGGFIKSSKDLEGLLDRFGPSFLTGARGAADLNAEEQLRYKGLIGQQAQSLTKYFEGVTGRELNIQGIEDLKKVYQQSNGNIDKIKQGLLGLNVPADQAEAITQLLKEGKGDLTPVFDAMLEIEERMQSIRDAQAAVNLRVSSGQVPITNISQLQQAFQRPGGITPAALGRVDYRQLNEGLGIERNKAFSQDFISQFATLSNEVGNTSKGIEVMKGFVEEAAKVQKDYNTGVITLTQASEKLKYTFDKIMFAQNESRMFSDERAQGAMDLRRSALRQGNFAEGFDPLTSFFDKFGDNAITTADKINQSFANLAENMQTGFEDAFGAFLDGTKTAEDAFRDFALNLAQQTIKEQFSIGLRSLLGNLTGGGGAATGIGGGGGIGGFLNNLFGGGGGGGFGFAKGGRVRGYSGGGYVDGGSGLKDDVPAMLQDGEYVLRKSAVNRYGLGMLNMLNAGGRVKGYAVGGSVNALLQNAYDFYGVGGERLTTQYTPEAFATTVTGPEQLGNIPALTGRFNISDLLSSRAMVSEDNPMVALRNERFLGMQNYQQQVANFKTGYNEQMRQVEEARRKAQEEADRINSERRAAFNRQRTGMLIGGLLNVGLQGFSALSSMGGGGGLFGGLFGGGGGGGGLNIGGLFQDIAGRGIGFLEKALTGGFGTGLQGGTVGGLSPEASKYMKQQIEQGQLTGFRDPFVQQAQLFPQFGGQGGFGGGFGGSMFSQPSSSFGGFQYNVGLGTPAGFQTQTQNIQDYYRTNFANPVAPLTYGRGNLIIATNPYDRTGQFYAKGGLVKGYQGGGKVESFVNRYYPYAIQAAQKLGTSPEAILSQLALESGYGTSKLSGSFNLGGLTAGKNYKGSTVSLPANKYDKNIGIYGNRTYRAYNSPQEFFDDYVKFLSRDRYKGALGITDPAARASALAKAQYVMGDPNYSAKIQRIAGRLQPVIAQNMLSGATMMADYRTIQTELDRQIKYASNVGRNAMSTDVDPEGAFITRGANISQRAPQQMAGFSFKLPQMFGTLDAPVRNPFAEANAPFFRPSGAPLKGPISTKTYTGPYVGPGRGGYPSYEAIKARVQGQGTGTGGAGSLFPDYNKIALDNLANQIFGGAGLAAQRLGGGATSLYQDVGSLLDLRDRGNYARIAARFAPFYGGTPQNRLLYQPTPSNFGQTGFNNYMKYIGLNPLTTSLDSLASYRAPMTPGMYSPYAFASSYFGGFGGSGYQSGFSSTGNVFSNYFSTGSRLGITPSWQARATGGPIYGGSSYRDDVPAMLMGGEYVIRKDVVDRMGEPFFNRLNRGQVQGFAEGGPVGTGLPSIGVGGEGGGQQDNSRVQFIEALTKLLRSLDQLNKTVEEQTREQRDAKEAQTEVTQTETGGGVTNNISISVNVDQNGKTTDTQKQENQDTSGNDMNDQEKFKKTLERSRMLSEMLRQQVLKVITEEQRPGGVLYQGSKGRDMGR